MTHQAEHEPLDVVKLIAAVRGLEAARILFAYRNSREPNIIPDAPALAAAIRFTSEGDRVDAPVVEARTR